MKALLLLMALLVASCGTPDRQITYFVDCGECRVRYSIADTTTDIRVQGAWRTTWNTLGRETYGIHVDEITGHGAGTLQVKQGDEVKYTGICERNDSCDLQYVGVTDVP